MSGDMALSSDAEAMLKRVVEARQMFMALPPADRDEIRAGTLSGIRQDVEKAAAGAWQLYAISEGEFIPFSEKLTTLLTDLLNQVEDVIRTSKEIGS